MKRLDTLSILIIFLIPPRSGAGIMSSDTLRRKLPTTGTVAATGESLRMFWRLLILCASLLIVTLALLGSATARQASAFELARLENELLARARLVRDTLQHVPRSGLQD